MYHSYAAHNGMQPLRMCGPHLVEAVGVACEASRHYERCLYTIPGGDIVRDLVTRHQDAL